MSEDDRPDLLEVLEHYGVTVTPGRVEQVVICASPDHDENRPSMTVNSIKGVFRCQACSFAGDVYTLIQARERTETFAATVQASLRLFGKGAARAPAGGSRPGLSGSSRPARGGYRPQFKRTGLRRGPDGQ